MDKAREAFAKGGHVQSIAFLVLSADPNTGEDLPAPQIGRLDGNMSHPTQRDAFEHVIRKTAKKTRALGVLHVFEAEAVEIVDSATGDEELDALLDVQEVGSHPEVKEVVFATFEHLRFDRMRVWEAEIRRPEGKKPTLGAFEEVPNEVVPSASQFSNWLVHFN